ncbi:DUF397 domain-containing protein [Streptomyces sp. NPDC001843]|uniref:DUF397 domain-containing protein n=1 Tax=Streptomyces sp. NPDC001843 TaxID=3364617 RepID=UPI00367BF285
MSDRLAWFKSSYSDSEGSNCLEAAFDWRKSSYSGTEGGNCLEIASCPHTIHVRDSKLGPDSPRFTVTGPAWTAFIASATVTPPA